MEVDYFPDCVLVRLILKLTDIPFSGTSCIVTVILSQAFVCPASGESQSEMKTKPQVIHRAHNEQDIITS